MPDKNPVQETLEIILDQLKNLTVKPPTRSRTANDLCRLLNQQPMFDDIDAAAFGISTQIG